MNFKKSILFLLSILSICSLFAQKNGANNYPLDPRNPREIRFELRDPYNFHDGVPMQLNASYQFEQGTIELKLKPLNERRIQYSHLWLPLFFKNDDYIYNLSLEQYFRRRFDTKIKISQSIKKQIELSGQKSFTLDKFINCTNGQIVENWTADILYPLHEDQSLTIHIKIEDVNKPVAVTFQNIVPLKAKKDFSSMRNKAKLAFIANQFSVNFQLTDIECIDQYDLIKHYTQCGKNLAAEYQNMLNLLKQTQELTNSDKEILYLKLYLKYEKDYKNIQETSCKELAEKYKDFSDLFSEIEKRIITPDSLQKLISEMKPLHEKLTKAVNTRDRNCNSIKKQTEKYNNINISESTYQGSDDEKVFEIRKLVLDFIHLRNELNKLKCPSSEIPTQSCEVTIQKIKKANEKINDLINEFMATRLAKEEEFNTIVLETDKELKKLSATCKKNNKKIIQDYDSAKAAFKKALN